MTKDFKLEILLFFKFTHHQALNSLTRKNPYFPHSFIKLSNFVDIGSARWRDTNFVESSKAAEEQCARIQPPLSF